MATRAKFPEWRFSRLHLPSTAELTLRAVRELSELSPLRPSPFRLHCLPYRPFELRPLTAWQSARMMTINY